jgi:hypothetical protein
MAGGERREGCTEPETDTTLLLLGSVSEEDLRVHLGRMWLSEIGVQEGEVGGEDVVRERRVKEGAVAQLKVDRLSTAPRIVRRGS